MRCAEAIGETSFYASQAPLDQVFVGDAQLREHASEFDHIRKPHASFVMSPGAALHADDGGGLRLVEAIGLAHPAQAVAELPDQFLVLL